MDNIDPYKILEVKPGFSIEELKSNYKRIALKVHPEKGGNEYMFNLVTDCFKHLMKEYKSRTTSSSGSDVLKSAFKKFIGTAAPKASSIGSSSSRFDVEKFNKMFDENRLDEFYDAGYEDWYKKEEVKEPPKFKGKTREAFNEHFEKHAGTISSKHTAVQEEPEAFWGSKLEWTELGTHSINDWSGDNNTLKRLNFSDLKIAHSTTRIVDPSTVNRKEYRSIDELKKDRGNIQYTMTPEEESRYLRRLKDLEEIEKKKREYLNQRDAMTENHFNKVHDLMKRALK